MIEYRYEWDGGNKKKKYMGKYQGANIEARGYFGNNTAGNPREANPNDINPFKREFIGSGQHEYTFYSDTKGVLTVIADSFEEAWRQAKARGYSNRRYKKKR